MIDLQERFAPVIAGFDDVASNVTRLVLTFQMFGLPIIVTEQYPKGLGGTVERVRSLFPMLEAVEKMELSAAENEAFQRQMHALNLETLVVCGIETHVCINQTALGLLAGGKTVFVVADAVSSRHSLDHSIALRKMEAAGAIITTTETSMFELAERAGTESFKNIQRMVKGRPKFTAGATVPHFPEASPTDASADSNEKVGVPRTAPAPGDVVQDDTMPEDSVVEIEELGGGIKPAPEAENEIVPAPDSAAAPGLDVEKDLSELSALLGANGTEDSPVGPKDDEHPDAN